MGETRTFFEVVIILGVMNEVIIILGETKVRGPDHSTFIFSRS
jgi:hypothetical protein